MVHDPSRLLTVNNGRCAIDLDHGPFLKPAVLQLLAKPERCMQSRKVLDRKPERRRNEGTKWPGLDIRCEPERLIFFRSG